MFGDLRYKQSYELQPPLPNEPSSSPIEDSWIYTFCIKCRGKDNSPSWEPPMWQKFCPFPLCPTFRQFARLWCIIIIGKHNTETKELQSTIADFVYFVFLNVVGVIAWFILYSIVGDSAYPGGAVFDLIALIVAAHIGGFLVSLTSLPRLIGMLATGILVQVYYELRFKLIQIKIHRFKFN